MKALPLQTIAALCGGCIIAGDASAIASGVSTDSRSIKSGDVFVALVGDKFDGHNFLPQVSAAGAVAVVVSKKPQDPVALGCAVIEVHDTLLALQSLARGHRRLLNALIIGITGSNGKTSTKDFLGAVMSRKYHVSSTLGNLNNHIGVPLTLLAMDESHACGVVEMGTNHPGEIPLLAAIAEPNAAVITNIGIAHIENFGTRDAIALEKGSLAEAVPAGGVVILHANDEFTDSIASRCKAKVLRAGVSGGDVRATIQDQTAAGTLFALAFPDGSNVEVVLPIPGEHMVANAALAAACAWHHGISAEEIAEALAAVKLTKGRVQIKNLRGILFLDDSYNANPDSMRAGIQTLAGMKINGRRVAVLGRMGELGPFAESGHRSVGESVAKAALDAVFTVGDEAALISQTAAHGRPGIVSNNFVSHEDAAAFLRSWLREGDAVLLKGSRSAAMEKVLHLLETS
jgi:UDP-N-acetylmuramoyl-tripeptide--D-alanyl-D-alanine ligase